MVVQHNLIAFMHAAIQFEDQSQSFAGEVSIIMAYRMLTAELVAVAPPGAKQRPNPALRQPG